MVLSNRNCTGLLAGRLRETCSGPMGCTSRSPASKTGFPVKAIPCDQVLDPSYQGRGIIGKAVKRITLPDGGLPNKNGSWVMANSNQRPVSSTVSVE
jgi:hypothetical protein